MFIRIILAALTLIPVWSALFISGPLEGLTCDSEAVQFANSAQLHSILTELSDTTFFRLVRVEGDDYCPIDSLRREDAEVGSTCGAVDSFSSTSPYSGGSAGGGFGGSGSGGSGGSFLGDVFGVSDPHPAGGLCSIQAEVSPQEVAETVVTSMSAEELFAQSEFPRDNDCIVKGTFEIRPDYWLDLCNSSSYSSHKQTEYVNLQLNPERNTGYNGSVVWKEMHSTIASFSSLEGIILQRLLSGYHASVSTQIMWSYFPPKAGETRWRPNPKKFVQHVFEPNKDRMKDMQFAFVLMARSLFKIKDYLYQYSYSTGNTTADAATNQLMHHLLDTSVLSACDQVFSAFDESIMFAIKEKRDVIATEFKKSFRRISRMVNCVTCKRCKLHASVAMHGMGAAIKILLTSSPDLVVKSLTRDDIVALVTTLHKFSDSITLANELMTAHLAATAAATSALADTSSLSVNQVVDRELAFVAQIQNNLTTLETDALVHGLVNRNPKLLEIAKHFSHWHFVRHSLIALNIALPDAVVVGGGIGGLVTALALAERGGSVVILEKGLSLGGNSAKASSGINSAEYGEIDAFLSDTLKSQNGYGSVELAKVLVENANASVTWLEKVSGVRLSAVGQLGGHSIARTHRPENGVVGAELMAALIGQVKRRSPVIRVLTGAKAVGILDKDGRVHGIEYEQDGLRKQQAARSVVVASGGFGFDSEGMLRSYRPDLSHFPTTLGAHTTGDGIRLAASLGADLLDMDKVQLHPTGFVDPLDREAKTKVLAAEILRGIGGVLLSRSNGTRFVNELGTRKVVSERMLEIGDSSFWILLSEHSARLEERLTRIYRERGLLRRVTREELVSAVGQGVMNHLKSYSENSVDEFGRADRKGLPLHDCEWWLLGEVVPVVHYTMGGIRVDSAGRVLRSDGSAISGLYGVGEVTGGVHGENRLGGNSLLECTVYGRIVGSQSIDIVQELELSHFPLDTTTVQQSTGAATTTARFTADEVAQHATVSDCWTIIDNSVYDLSKYAEEHPGGASAIRSSCGVDSTSRFLGAHSLGLLRDADFLPIGTLLTSTAPQLKK